MDRFIQGLWPSIRHRQTQRRRGQHTQRAGQHGGGIGQQVAEQVVGHDNIELLGPAAQLHRAGVGIHVGQLDVGIFLVVNLCHDLPPEHTGFHHIGLFHGTDLVATAAGEFKRRPRDAGNFGFRVALGVDANAFVAFHVDATRFAKVDARGQFAHDHDVQTGNDLFLERREIGQRVKALRRTQVAEQVHFLAQTQQTAFRFDTEVEVIILRATDGPQQDGIDLLGFGHRFVSQWRAVSVIGAAADQILGHVKRHVALVTIPDDDALHLGHDFGADAVSGEDQKGRVRHGCASLAVCGLTPRNAPRGQDQVSSRSSPAASMFHTRRIRGVWRIAAWAVSRTGRTGRSSSRSILATSGLPAAMLSCANPTLPPDRTNAQ